MSQKKSNATGKAVSFLANAWTIVTLVLALTDTVSIPWYVILGPYMVLLGLALVAALILGVVTALDD